MFIRAFLAGVICSVMWCAACGAATRMVNTDTTELSGETFSDLGEMQTTGGAVYNTGNLTISDSTFTNNHTDQEEGYGGAIYNFDVLNVQNSLFENNTAGMDGGAVYSTQTEMNFNNVIFRGNSAGDAGGAIGVGMDVNVIIKNSLFLNNTAGVSGGAISTTDGLSNAYIEISDSKFIGNSASDGGAIGNYSTYFTLTGVEFTKNRAENSGGAIHNMSELFITSGNFSQNKATLNGGAIYNDVDGTLYLTDTNFAENRAGVGGALYLTGGEVNISGGTFSDNNAIILGGAIYAGNGVYEITISNAQFFRNSANVAGGAILMGSDSVIDGALFNGNTSLADGGAIYYSNRTNNEISASQFIGNRASDSGGAIYIGQDSARTKLTITNSSFSDNHAENNGGAIYNAGIISFSGENTFAGNTAGNIQNDIYNSGTINITDGTTSFTGGISGRGQLTVSDGATLELNGAKIQQSVIDISGATLKISLNNESDYGRIIATSALDVTDTNIEISAVGAAGVYNIFQTNARSGVSGYQVLGADDLHDAAAKIFNLADNGSGTINITVKSPDEIAQNAGLSLNAARAVAAMAGTSNLYEMTMATQNAMNAGDIADVESMAQKLHPETAPVLHAITTMLHTNVINMASDRMSGTSTCAYSPYGDFYDDMYHRAEYGSWAHGFGTWGNHDNFTYDTYGISAGVDTMIDDTFTIGFGYTYSDTKSDTDSRHTDISSNTLFLYGEYQPHNAYINASAAYNIGKFRESDTVFDMDIKSDFYVHSFGGHITTGYEFAGGFAPEIGARYMHIETGSYENLFGKIDIQPMDYLTGIIGVRIAPDLYSTDCITIRPHMRAAATYDAVSDNGIATVSVADGAPYMISASHLGRFGGEFAAGIAALLCGTKVGITYELDMRNGYTAQSGIIRFRHMF